jgi:gliotoxin/aspirochlorine biosynthesis thioredoxin reductase
MSALRTSPGNSLRLSNLYGSIMSFVDVLIIGGGPAGLSAALTLVRQRHTVLLFDTNECRANPSYRIHGYTSFDRKPPSEYLEHAYAELKPYDSFTKVAVEVTNLAKVDSGFEATDSAGKKYSGKKIILAHGVIDKLPDIPGFAEAWGKGM